MYLNKFISVTKRKMNMQNPVMGLNKNSEIIETLQQICGFVAVVY